jgi:hypothetical protein
MGIYHFGNSFTFMDIGRSNSPIGGANELNPQVDTHIWSVEQDGDHQGGATHIMEGGGVTEPLDVVESLDPGFRYLDAAMKMYWSDIRIPTKDSYRFMRTKVAGASKSLQVWRDDMKHARVQLPVMSISRLEIEYFPDKFSPAYIPMRTIPANRAMTRARNVFRPVPYNLYYTLTIWSEHKRDAEYALKQVLMRFNPLAEFIANDEHVYGSVTNHLRGSADVSEKEATAEQKAKIRYEITLKAEAWLSLPETTVPTILGTVQVDQENIIEEEAIIRTLGQRLWR